MSNKAIYLIVIVVVAGVIGYFVGMAAMERELDRAEEEGQEQLPVEESQGQKTSAGFNNVLYQYEWVWQSRTDEGDMVSVPVNAEQFVLVFNEDGRVTSTTDCNNAMGSFETGGNELTFGPLATTRRACPGETSEQEYVRALGEVTAYELFDLETDSPTLALTGDQFDLTFVGREKGSVALSEEERFCADLKERVAGSEDFVVMTTLAGSSTVVSGQEIAGCVYAPNGSYGGWAPFEGQVGSYQVVDTEGNELGSGPLPVISDLWMEEAMVGKPLRYEGELTFDNDTATSGAVILKNENASGESERDREVSIPVRF